MSTIVTRAGKGSPLTHVEVDANFTNLNTDKVEKTSAAITGGTINGTTIGATSATSGKFSTLEATGTSTLGTGSSQYIQAEGGATAVLLSAQGSGTNIPLALQPKGTGAIQAQATTSTTAGGNARGTNAVDWQTLRNSASQVASSTTSVLCGGDRNTAATFASGVVAGQTNTTSGSQGYQFIGGGSLNSAGAGTTGWSVIAGGDTNTAAGFLNFIGGGFTNSGTASAAVTTQSGTMNATTAVTLSGSNASIKVGQYITGTSISSRTYVAAISGTALTLSKNASGSSTSTLSFFTPHGVVVGGGNNQATGAYSFIGGGGDAGTAANRNVASGDWSFVGSGQNNTASGKYSAILGYYATASGISAIALGDGPSASGSAAIAMGRNGIANSAYSTAMGMAGSTRSITGYIAFSAQYNSVGTAAGNAQGGLLVLGAQTTNATATALTCDSGAAGSTNQVILPNNSAYLFKATVISNVTGGGNTSGWKLEGVIKRGANAASTAIVGLVTTTLLAQDAGAATWAIAATADTTNGGLRITFTGQASTTIRTVCKVETTEMTY